MQQYLDLLAFALAEHHVVSCMMYPVFTANNQRMPFE
jgi:hypothetical protein